MAGDKKEVSQVQEDKYWFIRTPQEVFSELNTTDQGLSANEAQERLKRFGPNSIEVEKSFKWWKALLEKTNSILIYILTAAAFIAFLTDEYIEGYVIIAIILLTIVLGFLQEYKADNLMKALGKLTAKKVEVFRAGKRVTVPAEELVVGDIVLLSRGVIVPADLRLFELSGLQINEAIITGESVSKTKYVDICTDQDTSLGDRKNIAFSGTAVTSGSGKGVVVDTGFSTEIGKISHTLTQVKPGASPIQRKIDHMSKKISYIVLAVAAIVLTILWIRGYPLEGALLITGALIVSGIPESFPLALTMTMTHGIKNMNKQNAIVKEMNSVETLGTTTVICTDKTGTLTENKMRVTKLRFSTGTELKITGQGYDPTNEYYHNEVPYTQKDLDRHKEFFQTAVLCNDAEITFEEGTWELRGEPTEGAIITLAKGASTDDVVARQRFKRIHEIPFDPAKKYMITVNKDPKSSSLTAHLKGAPERVLPMCTHYRHHKKLIRMTSVHMNNILKHIVHENSQGFRTLAIANKPLSEKTGKNASYDKELTKGFIYEGFVTIEDPLRKDALDAVVECMSAGIRVVMVTGDHKNTATTIGERLGIIKSEEDLVVEGTAIDKMTDEQLKSIIGQVAVFSRSTPEQKLRIVTALQEQGEIVAMTGDGVNDAPALKKADIGVAMGKGGTEVAREAANMVLTDDNFSTIVKAVKEGRTVYSNIRRFIYYLLTGNFTEVAVISLAVIFGLLMPLTALMILFVNIVTSTIPALALSTEPTHPKVMLQKPRNPKEKLLSRYVLTKILTLVPVLTLGILGLFIWEHYLFAGEYLKAQTLAFATLIMFELFHAFNARRLHTTIFNKEFFSHKPFFTAIMVSIVFTVLVIQLPALNTIFKTVPLSIIEWGVILLISSLVVVFSEVTKLSIHAEFKEQSNLYGENLRLR